MASWEKSTTPRPTPCAAGAWAWGVFTDKSKQGGGPLIDIGTHSLDLTLWFMDNYEPAAVTGVTFEKLGKTLPPQKQGNGMGPWDPDVFEVEDAAFGFVTMKDGSLTRWLNAAMKSA